MLKVNYNYYYLNIKIVYIITVTNYIIYLNIWPQTITPDASPRHEEIVKYNGNNTLHVSTVKLIVIVVDRPRMLEYQYNNCG